MEYQIDASEQILGRLATKVALLLRGKETAGFSPNQLSKNKVVVYNLDKLRVSGKKMEQKLYRRHSGYHGGLKEVLMKNLMRQDSRRVFSHAVMGMLPKNRMRARLIKNLVLHRKEAK